MGARRKARECALQLLYQWDSSGEDPAAVEAAYWKQMRASAPTKKFAHQLFTGTVAAAGELDKLISEHSQNWRLERMPALDRNLLRLAAHELQAYPETPPAVVINEALEIAHRYCGKESAEFLNGVLDAIRKTLEARPKV